MYICCDITGTETWPPGVCLKYVGGDQFGHVNIVMVRSLDPQEISEVSVQMRSPVTPGMYQGQWRMCTATGLFYGGETQSGLYVCPVHYSASICHLFSCYVILSENYRLSSSQRFFHERGSTVYWL